MIRYALRCTKEHAFEGWFRSSAEFDRQSECGLLSCPVCGTTGVTRGLMAPALIGKGRPPVPQPRTQEAPEAPGTAGTAPDTGEILPPTRTLAPPQVPDAVRALLGRMRDAIEKHCDDVGRDFARQAIGMHRGDIEQRGIYGETTESERDALADEGVEVGRIPWLPRTES